MSTKSGSNPGNLSSQDVADPSRRTWIGITCGAGAVGGGAAGFAFLNSFQPSERAKAAGAPVEVDIGDLKEGEMKSVEWRGNPVWIVRRTKAMLDSLAKTEPKLLDPQSVKSYQIPSASYAKTQQRSLKPEYLVVVGICSHLGCSPSEKFTPGAQPSLPDDWAGGFLCPCHGSTFDLAGRVYKNKPANTNLDVPPHHYISDTRLLIGEDKKTA